MEAKQNRHVPVKDKDGKFLGEILLIPEMKTYLKGHTMIAVATWDPNHDDLAAITFLERTKIDKEVVDPVPDPPCAICRGRGYVIPSGWMCGCGPNVEHDVPCDKPVPKHPCPKCNPRKDELKFPSNPIEH